MESLIYQAVRPDEAVSQGDLLDDCPILLWDDSGPAADAPMQSATARVRAVVLTQACDLAQQKATRVLVAVVHDAQHLVDRGVLKPNLIRDHLRNHRVYGWYFLPTGPALAESVVDLRDLHTLPRQLLERLAAAGKRVCRIVTPYREHLAQHFATTYSRIGLPTPYETRPES
ncbi:MAG: hypothetical protein ACLQVX_10090 [Limisphaerales bacterium]